MTEFKSRPTAPPYYPPGPWPAPDPGTRHPFADEWSSSALPFDVVAPPSRPRRRSGRRFVALLALAALVIGGGAVVAAKTSDHQTASSPPTTSATVRIPKATPATSPSSPTTLPAIILSPATNPPVTDPPVTDPAVTDPAATDPAATNPTATDPAATGGAGGTTTQTTTANQSTTSSKESLNIGVVDINTVLKYQSARAAGTGMVLTAAGEILTNNHVVDGATGISVTIVTTGKTYTATVVGTDPTQDIAVLQLKGATNLQTTKFGQSSTVKVGAAVTAVGNAGGVGGTPSVSTGTVTALNQAITATDADGSNGERLNGLLQISANLQPGDSGGPLYDANGAVIGINTAGSASRIDGGRSTEGYAIPIDTALDIAHQIEAGIATDTITIGTPGFLGIAPQDSTQSVSGAELTEIVPGSPAEKIGLQVGDVITKIGSDPIDSAAAVGTALHGSHGGDKIVVTWVSSDGTHHTATATLIVGPAN